jgi:hypothetical protein
MALVVPIAGAYTSTINALACGAQEEGYEYLGISSFYGHAESLSREKIIKQAQRVGASMVLVQTNYKDTITGLVPNTDPGDNSGGIGSAAYSKYSTTSTQSGKMTNNVPYSVTGYDIVATFWVHRDMNQVYLGVVAESLPEDVRARHQRNTGVIAVVVMRGTPAFNAKMLTNDVILKIGGEAVIDPHGFDEQLIKFEGQTVDIELLRGDTHKTVTVTLNRPH